MFCGVQMEYREFVVLAGPGLGNLVGDCRACGKTVNLVKWQAFQGIVPETEPEP